MKNILIGINCIAVNFYFTVYKQMPADIICSKNINKNNIHKIERGK